MNYKEMLTDHMIDPSENYSSKLIDIINEHNMSIDSFSHTLMITSLLLALNKKGIITEDEYDNALEELSNFPSYRNAINQFQENAKQIRDLIEFETCGT